MKISLDRAASGLERIRPPADATADQQALVSEMRDFASPEAAYRYTGIAEPSGSVL